MFISLRWLSGDDRLFPSTRSALRRLQECLALAGCRLGRRRRGPPSGAPQRHRDQAGGSDQQEEARERGRERGAEEAVVADEEEVQADVDDDRRDG